MDIVQAKPLTKPLRNSRIASSDLRMKTACLGGTTTTAKPQESVRYGRETVSAMGLSRCLIRCMIWWLQGKKPASCLRRVKRQIIGRSWLIVEGYGQQRDVACRRNSAFSATAKTQERVTSSSLSFSDFSVKLPRFL
jgi:hypothetical protein